MAPEGVQYSIQNRDLKATGDSERHPDKAMTLAHRADGHQQPAPTAVTRWPEGADTLPWQETTKLLNTAKDQHELDDVDVLSRSTVRHGRIKKFATSRQRDRDSALPVAYRRHFATAEPSPTN